MRTPIVAGNWKMNGSKASIEQLLAELKSGLAADRASVVVCAPFPYLGMVAEHLSGTSIQWGAQNASEYGAGAYTGEVSVSMLVEFGCSHVILGHSERRALFGESSEQVAEKFCTVLEAGLTPILCVGETLEQREAGQTLEVVSQQLLAVVEMAGIDAFSKAVLAYEPVWAIGTGLTATPEQAQEVHQALRGTLEEQSAPVAAAISILYGGSVKADNAGILFGCPDIDGGLIGGASLKSEEFLAICQAAE